MVRAALRGGDFGETGPAELAGLAKTVPRGGAVPADLFALDELFETGEGAMDAGVELLPADEPELCFRIVEIKNVDSVHAHVGAAALNLVFQEIGRHRVHAARDVAGRESGRDRAGGEEARLGAHHDLIALELLQCSADLAFGLLVAIIDGGIEKIDAAFRGGQQRLDAGVEIGADPERRNGEIEDRTEKAGVPKLGVPVGVAEGAGRGRVHRGMAGPSPAPDHSETAFESISFWISARNSATGLAPWSPCLRLRTATCCFSCSRSPTTSMYGIFCNCASRILRFTFSLRSSSVARMSASSSCLRTERA